MARSAAAAAAAALFVCYLLLLSDAVDITKSAVTEDSKGGVTTQVLPTGTVSTFPLRKEALEASFVPVPVDEVHIGGPLTDLKDLGGDDGRPIHVKFFQTHRPVRLNIRVQAGEVVPPEWLGGRRMGAGLRFHRGHGVNCEFMKRMMNLKAKDDGSPMMHHHHKHHYDVEEKKEGGGLVKWLRGLVDLF